MNVSVDEAFMKGIQEIVGGQVPTQELMRDALTILNWAMREAAAGRVVLSTNADGKDIHRLVMPVLKMAEAQNHRACHSH